MAAAAEGSLPRPVIEAAVEAVAPAGQALRQLTLALAADPGALSCGAPPVAGRLAAELIARGSATLAIPACAVCGRAGKPLFRGDGGGVCQRCRTWQLAAACASAAARSARPLAGTALAGPSARSAAAGTTRGATASAADAGRPPRSRREPVTAARISA